jgi:hypothetical protein
MRKEKNHKLWIITEFERLYGYPTYWHKNRIAKELCISESTLYRILKEDGRKVRRGKGDIV